jgi:hypothetical protein
LTRISAPKVFCAEPRHLKEPCRTKEGLRLAATAAYCRVFRLCPLFGRFAIPVSADSEPDFRGSPQRSLHFVSLTSPRRGSWYVVVPKGHSNHLLCRLCPAAAPWDAGASPA